MARRKLIESYTIIADNVPADISIYDDEDENVPVYEVKMPQLGPGTDAMLENLKDKIAESVPLEITGVVDTKKHEAMKQKFFGEIRKIIDANVPEKNEDKKNIMAGILLHRMFGLGIIDVILADNFLEELAINGAKEPVSIYHKKHGWCKTTVRMKSDEDVYNLSDEIARKVGREINTLNPIMDAHLLTGDRVASTLFPISTQGNTITIRRFARNPWTIVTLIDPKNKTLSIEVAAFLWLAVQYELNVLVAGGTASGKTSILSALCSLFPPNQRILSIEDTREISLPEDLHWNWVPMTTRNANLEKQGEVTMLDLMVAALRMRPDKIIVGEVRRKAQAETMFEAMHTGHSVYTTIHADTAEQVKRRLLEPPIEIPKNEVEALHLVLVQFRDRRKGMRRTLELAEILTGEEELTLNYLYRWYPRDDKFEKVGESIRVMEDLNLHTGMTPEELKLDLAEKEMILQWMLDNELKDIDMVGQVMKHYYKNKEVLLKVIRNKENPKSIIALRQE